MNKKEFIKILNDFGWQDIKKITKGMKGKIKYIKSNTKFKIINLPSINNMSKSRQQLELWIKSLTNIKGNILDIGGSQLSILKRLNNTELNIKNYKILDLEQPHEQKEKVDIVCDLNKYHFVTLKDSISPLDYYEAHKYKEYFDISFCIEVSEYWWNPVQALDNINYFLKKDGILYLSCHFVYMIHAPKHMDFMRYTPDGIEKILNETGFEILDHKYRVAENEYLTKFYAYDKMRGLRNNINHNVVGSLIKCKKM